MRVPLRLLAHLFCTSTRVPLPNFRSISYFLYYLGLFKFNFQVYLFINCLFMRVPLRLLAHVFSTSTRVPLPNMRSISHFLYYLGLFTFNFQLYLFINCLLSASPYGSWHMYSVHWLQYVCQILDRYLISCTVSAFLHLNCSFIYL